MSRQERIKYLLNFTSNLVDIHGFIFSNKINLFEKNACFLIMQMVTNCAKCLTFCFLKQSAILYCPWIPCPWSLNGIFHIFNKRDIIDNVFMILTVTPTSF